MSTQPSDRNLALFIDFDNVALGARDARMRFDCRMLLQRVLEKGKVVVKRAYADWHHYREHMTSLHEAAIELIEVPMPRISGKNSADIRMVVDAIDLCYSKDHIDTFVLVSGDSDFSPLVSKLRENNKRVIGVGMRNSSSHLLISNCDEWIFYDDIYQTTVVKLSEKVASVPADKRELFDFLLNTTQSLLQESRGVLYSSLVKDTMKRKQPDFNETNYGYATFGDLLEDMRDHGLLTVERDSRAGGTLVVLGLGKSEPVAVTRTKVRRSRRGRDRERIGGDHDAEPGGPALPTRPEPPAATAAAPTEAPVAKPIAPPVEVSATSSGPEDTGLPTEERSPARRSRRRSSRRRRGGRGDVPATASDGTPPPAPIDNATSRQPAPLPTRGADRKLTTTKKTVEKTAAKKPVAKAKSLPPKSLPTKTVPTKLAPVKTAPATTLPTKTAPVKTAPAKTAPAKTAPAKTAPAKTAKMGAKKANRGKGAGGSGQG
jgi:uncharacterized protein (TIGR00288 family)